MSTTVPPDDLLPASPPHVARLPGEGWLPPAILSAVALLNGIGLLLVTRRLAGAFSTDLPLWQVFVTALIATTLARQTRIQWRRQVMAWDARQASLLDQMVGWGASTGLLLVAGGCCYPGYRNGEWLAWLPLLIADQFWRQNFFDNGRPGAETSDAAIDSAELNQADVGDADRKGPGLNGADLNRPELARPAPSVFDAEGSDPAEMAENLADEATCLNQEAAVWPSEADYVQQVFRVRDADGQEVVYAAVRADFLAGQRHAIVHVGFCPPLAATPLVEAAACQWPDARVRVTQALPHGVRLDVRLGEPAEEACGVPIDLAATPSLPVAAGGAARVV